MSQCVAYATGAAAIGQTVGYEMGTSLGMTVGGTVGGLAGSTCGWCYHMSPCMARRGQNEKEEQAVEIDKINQKNACNTGGECAAAGASIGGTLSGYALAIPLALALGVAGSLVGLSVDASSLCCGKSDGDGPKVPKVASGAGVGN
mmetsp:Transcript_8845/g.17743  ORF Transcript_8845/g.17743 Transcript_8845/m.17743 type:complete len:146 (-) Transcript_8845:137-574(-)